MASKLLGSLKARLREQYGLCIGALRVREKVDFVLRMKRLVEFEGDRVPPQLEFPFVIDDALDGLAR